MPVMSGVVPRAELLRAFNQEVVESSGRWEDGRPVGGGALFGTVGSQDMTLRAVF